LLLGKVKSMGHTKILIGMYASHFKLLIKMGGKDTKIAGRN